jgi:hypothetical protein
VVHPEIAGGPTRFEQQRIGENIVYFRERKKTMAKRTGQLADDLLTLTKSVFVDLPLVRMRWGWGFGTEEAVTETAWRGYDAAVRLTTAAIDNLYRLPLYGAVMRSATPVFLRWQQVSNAMIGAAAAGLWQVVGLSTKAETRALQEAVAHLGAELRAQREESKTLVSLAARVVQALEEETLVTPPPVFKRFVLNEQLSQPKATPTTHPKGN